MSKINCEEFMAEVYNYADNSLCDNAEDMQAHMAECEDCKNEYEKVKLMLDTVKQSELVPDSRLYNSVMAEIVKENKKKSFNFRSFAKYGSIVAGIAVIVALTFSSRFFGMFDNYLMSENNKENYAADEDSDNRRNDLIQEGEYAAEDEGVGAADKATDNDLNDSITQESAIDKKGNAITEGDAIGEEEPECLMAPLSMNYYCCSYDESITAGAEEYIGTFDTVDFYTTVADIVEENADIEFDTVNVYHRNEGGIWEVVLYMEANPEVKQVLKFDSEYNLIEE